MEERGVNIEVLNWRICVVRPTKFIRNGGDCEGEGDWFWVDGDTPACT